MIYLKWLLMAPIMWVVTILTFPLAFVLPAFVEEREGVIDNGTYTDYGWYLPTWLNWFQTPDNSIDGDQGWREEHMQWRFKFPEPIATYLGRVGWLWRNPGCGFGVLRLSGNPIIAVPSGNPKVNDSPGVEGYCLVKTPGAFQFVYVKRISDSKCLYANFGWGINGLVDEPKNQYTAAFQFSPRISTWKE